MRNSFWLLFSCLFSLILPGCSDPVAVDDPTGTVVFGITSDFRLGVDIDRLRVVTREAGEVTRDETLTAADGGLYFPYELRFEAAPEGTSVEVDLEAFATGSQQALVKRRASSTILADRTLLLRVVLELECRLTVIGECAAPTTCATGTCRDPFVSPGLLEDYKPGWGGSGTSDICKPAEGGDPVVTVGKGQSEYLPMADLEVAQIEAGPQGGHHIWVAIRMKNLRQSGSITQLTGLVPESGQEISPFNVIFTFDQDEGGYCKLYGLRFQLDQAVAIEELLGKILEVTVTVTDSEGAVGTGVKQVTLSDTIL